MGGLKDAIGLTVSEAIYATDKLIKENPKALRAYLNGYFAAVCRLRAAKSAFEGQPKTGGFAEPIARRLPALDLSDSGAVRHYSRAERDGSRRIRPDSEPDSQDRTPHRLDLRPAIPAGEQIASGGWVRSHRGCHRACGPARHRSDPPRRRIGRQSMLQSREGDMYADVYKEAGWRSSNSTRLFRWPGPRRTYGDDH